jgi:hypothetical protein
MMSKRDGIGQAEIESAMIHILVMSLFLTMVCTLSEGHNTWRLVMTMRIWFGMCSEVALRFCHISSTSTLVCIHSIYVLRTFFCIPDVLFNYSCWALQAMQGRVEAARWSYQCR